jgi:hypothetical protein
MRRLAVLLLAFAMLACHPTKGAFQLGIPGTRIPMSVERVKPRFGFLDATLEADGWSLRTFVPATETCTRILDGEADLEFRSSGPYGSVQRAGQTCQASGIGSLAEWRKRQPRGDTSSVIPSAQATYRVVYEDEELAFLRGNFPITWRLGFTAMGDAIAVVPRTAVCRRPIESGRATLEYFFGGRNVLTLSSRDGRCNIEGLIRPLAAGDVES